MWSVSYLFVIDIVQDTCVAFTAVAYAGDGIVYIGTDSGKVSAWDTGHNTCFMHWNADTGEIS